MFDLGEASLHHAVLKEKSIMRQRVEQIVGEKDAWIFAIQLKAKPIVS
jgi:hypothetical protein